MFLLGLWGSRVEGPLRAPLRVPLGVPLRVPLGVPLRVPLRVPFRVPLEIPLRVPLRAPLGVPLRVPLGVPLRVGIRRNELSHLMWQGGWRLNDQSSHPIEPTASPSRASIFSEGN